MAKTINIKKIAELIDEEPFDINWFNYDFGGGWGLSINKKGVHNRNHGQFVQGINKDINVQKVVELVKNHDFDDIAGFYVAIFLFFGKRFIDKVDFCDKTGRNRISRFVDNLKGPIKFKDDIYDFLEQDFDFIEFLEAFGRYKLQGDDAIFPILCQVFYVNKFCDGISVALIDDLPVHFPIQVSNFLSGCHFPVAVSPVISDFKWEENQNGHFLYGKLGDEWLVLDVAGVGRVNLSNYPLTNRLNYLGGGGVAIPYLICWNWGEIIDAYHHFGCSLLVRDLRNSLFNHYWFNFGLDSLVCVEFQDNMINCSGDYALPSGAGVDLPCGQKLYVILRLNGDFYEYCDKEDICFSKSEIYDWFELGEMLK